MDKIDQENEQLRVTKKRLEKEVRGVERSSKSVHNELSVIRDVEKRSKNSLLTEADEATRLRQENIELETRYENLQASTLYGNISIHHMLGILLFGILLFVGDTLCWDRINERQNSEFQRFAGETH